VVEAEEAEAEPRKKGRRVVMSEPRRKKDTWQSWEEEGHMAERVTGCGLAWPI
jgi:hypothetical protein